MRLRQLVLACGLASLALSAQVSALGLGEVKLKSTLNQPLEAEVKLLDTRDLTAEQILVTLASPADFERNGVDRLFFYTEFQFTVDLDAPDGPKVLITSRNPVREPYLNFLIEARWTAGRLLREYTLLMDLPTFADEGAPSTVQTATTSPARAVRQSNATSEPSSTYSPPARASSGSGGGNKPALSGDEYEVRSNDTLWEIALRARPDSSVSVHQSMMALYQANPDAFIDGNINRLRRGQVLRIPDANEMKSLGKSEAVSQFTAASNGAVMGAQINASRRASGSRAESAEVAGRVTLAAPSAGSGSGQASGANDGAGAALESELAATLEELDKSKAENTELSSRVKDLEAQIETMQRLVDVSNEKLRALQVAAQQGTAEAVQPPAETTVVQSSAAVDAPVAQVAPVEPVVAPEPVTAPEPVAASSAASSVAAVVPPQTQKVVSRPAPQPTLVDTAVENAPWIGLGILGLGVAGLVAYRRRQQKLEEQQALEQENVFAMDEVADEPDAQPEPSSKAETIDERSLFEEDDSASAVAETGDVVGEADIYIAYGKLDQAEEMLLNALKKDPDSSEIRMKLLEVYAQQQNASSFDKHYAALLPIAGAALLTRASELRAGIPGAGEFSASEVSNETSSADEFALDDLNLDLDDDLTTSPETSAPNYTASDFDFSLDLDDHETSAKQAESPSSVVDSDFDLDLDLNDDQPTDDLSELSLALDEMDQNELPDDVQPSSTALDSEFNFDLGDDLALDDDLALNDELSLESDLVDEDAPVSTVQNPPDELELVDDLTLGDTETDELSATTGEVTELDVADDFNLDMDVDGIDLAALDHEMESLDVDFDDEDIDLDTASISDFAAEEIAKDKEEPGLDLDEDMQLEDLTPSHLSLTDDLDDADQSISFDLDDDAVDADLEANFSSDSDFGLPGEDDALKDEGVASFAGDFDDGADRTTMSEVGDAQPASEDTDDHGEDLFSQALSEFSSDSDDLDLNEFSSDEAALADLSDDDMDSELDFLADADEAATKLDLARAYIDMGDTEGAKDILSEVVNEGSDEQRKEANELLGRIV